MLLELPKNTMEESIFQSPQLHPEDMRFDLERDDTSDTALFEIRDGVKESCEEMTAEQVKLLGIQFDYDGSYLTPEQRKAILMRYFAMHLKDNGLRSPRYYEDKSQCLSIAETAWPGAVGYVKADRLKRGYIEPEDLIERLRKLKPSDNFELRKHGHAPMEWEKSPVYEKAYTIDIPQPDWLLLQRGGVGDSRRQLGNRWTEHIINQINERWDEVARDIEQTPTPDLHLLRDMGHSPGGTVFPRYLVKGLMSLREEADEKGGKYYDEEYKVAEVKKEVAIDRWRERNPDMILADDPVSLYRTWPADLMDKLDEIDREAIRCGRRRYIALLRGTEKEMQELVTFWRDCGLITGQRTPHSPQWPDPKAKVRGLEMPPYLKDRLDAIETEFGRLTDKGKRLTLIEISRWKEAILNSETEPTPSDTPLPQLLLNELDVVWQGRDWLELEETEDSMITRISQWRKSEGRQRCEEGPQASPQLVGDSEELAPKEMRQIQENPSRGAHRRSRTKIMMTEDWGIRLRPRPKTTWRDRLRPRPDAFGASCDRTTAAMTQNVKLRSIIKQYGGKASKNMRQAATKGHAATPITQKEDTSGTQSHFNGATLQAIPAAGAKSTRAKNSRCQSSYQASRMQPQGIQKIRNGKQRQTRGPIGAALTTEHKQGLLHLLTPPQS